MTGELEIIAQVSGSEAMVSKKSRRGAAFKRQWKFAFTQFHERSQRADEGIGTAVTNPTHRAVRAGTQVPVRVDTPVADEGSPEYFGLVQSVGVALQNSAAASAGKKIQSARPGNDKDQYQWNGKTNCPAAIFQKPMRHSFLNGKNTSKFLI